MMLHLLPTEIALQTISYLPSHSLYSIALVSRDWNALIATNEPTVYRNAAILHRFVGNPLGAGSAPVNWKAYCRRQLEVEKGWRGKAPTVVQELAATGSMVHRIKVDDELGVVITTCQTGGLFVCDIKSDLVLWALPPSHTVHYAHLEYDRGYIVFNRHDNCKEVWRRTIDADADQHPEASPPDQKMLDVSMRAAASYYSADGSYRGHFKAWALLRLPETSRAFRLSYPTLLAVAESNAYLWDVTTLKLISVIRNIQRQQHDFLLAAINYVEVNNLYVFICGAGGLRIFAREGGALLYQLSTRELSSATWDILPQTPGLPSSIVQPQMLLHNHHSSIPFYGEFMACHVSPSGNDLAALTTNGRLVILPDFQRLFSGSDPVHHRDIAIILNFQFQPSSNEDNISCYLAVGNRNGKLAAATQKGIFIVSLDFDFVRLTTDCPPEPGVSVCRLSKFENDRLLFYVSCLQITHDAIYVTYKPSQTERPSDTTHHAQVHDEVDDPFDVDMDDMEDAPFGEWEDEDFENGEMGLVIGGIDEPEHILINNWFQPSASNTVYRVSF